MDILEKLKIKSFFDELVEKTANKTIQWRREWDEKGRDFYSIESLTLGLYQKKLYTRLGYFSYNLPLTWWQARKLRKAIQKQEEDRSRTATMRDIDRIHDSMNWK